MTHAPRPHKNVAEVSSPRRHSSATSHPSQPLSTHRSRGFPAAASPPIDASSLPPVPNAPSSQLHDSSCRVRPLTPTPRPSQPLSVDGEGRAAAGVRSNAPSVHPRSPLAPLGRGLGSGTPTPQRSSPPPLSTHRSRGSPAAASSPIDASSLPPVPNAPSSQLQGSSCRVRPLTPTPRPSQHLSVDGEGRAAAGVRSNAPSVHPRSPLAPLGRGLGRGDSHAPTQFTPAPLHPPESRLSSRGVTPHRRLLSPTPPQGPIVAAARFILQGPSTNTTVTKSPLSSQGEGVGGEVTP